MDSAKPLLFIMLLIATSLILGSQIKAGILDLSSVVLRGYFNTKTYIINAIDNHFNQVDEIKKLRAENSELKRSATLLSTFASQLDQILIDKNSSRYNPSIELVKTLSYVQIGDFNSFWVDFKGFDSSKVYGAIYEGNTIGVVAKKDNRPLAILQNDPRVAFSVYIGIDRIPGLLNGDGKDAVVKYIPQWLEPKVGDKVYTSGLDGIFFAGVPVGEVVRVVDEELYKSAVLKSYSKPNIPSYIYVITKEN